MSKILPAQVLTINDVAVFLGEQETPQSAPWFGKPVELWNLTENLTPTLQRNFTVDRNTIESALKLAA